jgi:hypothetical protein
VKALKPQFLAVDQQFLVPEDQALDSAVLLKRGACIFMNTAHIAARYLAGVP